MDMLGMWLTPLILVPGVAMLVLSTSMRYGQLHEEFHRLEDHTLTPGTADHLHRRARLLRNALVSLYVSVSLFASASLLGGIATLLYSRTFGIIELFSCLGIIMLVYAASQLVRESTLSMRIITEHCDAARHEETRKL